MSIWSPIKAFSLPTMDSWYCFPDRTYIWDEQGIFLFTSDAETYLYQRDDILSFDIDETHWVFQTEDGLFWSEIDEEPKTVDIPADVHLYDFSTKGMLVGKGLLKMWIPFSTSTVHALPSGCKKPLIRGERLYWEENGTFYSWDEENLVRVVGQSMTKVASFLVGSHDWVAIPEAGSIRFMQYGQSFALENISEVVFHKTEELALLLRGTEVLILELQERNLMTQFLPPTDKLLGFPDTPVVLGLDTRYIFTTADYLEEPEGTGPEFTFSSMVLRNSHTYLGLSGSLWSSNQGRPVWICDVPDFDNAWVSQKGYLLFSGGDLLFVDNAGEWEEIADVNVDELAESTTLELEGLGVFIHWSEIPKSPVEYDGLFLDDSDEYWAWNEEGMWIDISQ